MGNRLSKIYTRTGDAGTTGLGDGTDAALLELGQSKSTTVDPAQQAQLGIDTVAQQVHDFGQYRPGRHQRELVAAQKRHAALVVTIGRVEQGQ